MTITSNSSRLMASTTRAGHPHDPRPPMTPAGWIGDVHTGVVVGILCMLANAWAVGIIAIARTHAALASSGPDVRVPLSGVAALFLVAFVELAVVWIAWARLVRSGNRGAGVAGAEDKMRAEGFEPPTPAL